MQLIRDLGIREITQEKTGKTKRFRFASFLCPVCGCEAERKKGDGLKQKRCCGGVSKIAPKGSPLHNRYVGMTQRCWDKNAINYSSYGGRGIKVCDEWRNFDNFAKWALANGFNAGLQLDRINGNEGYNPENCRFITCEENQRNKANNIHSVDDIKNIIKTYVCTPISMHELAVMFNDSPGNISNILNKRSWNIETEWDKYIDEVKEAKRILPNKIRAMWLSK